MSDAPLHEATPHSPTAPSTGPEQETEVLIVGGGPVGLTLALDLRAHGVACVVLEAGDGSVSHPKVSNIGPRSMEYYRRWGLADRIRSAGWPPEHTLDSAWVTRVGGHEVYRLRFGSALTRPPFRHTPEPDAICPQHWLSPLLADAVGHHPHGPLRLRCRLDGFTQDQDGVTATATDLARQRSTTLRARYLIACDGAASPVRKACAIPAPARFPTQVFRNILFRAPELRAQLGERNALFYFLLLSDTLRFPMRAMDGDGLFRLSVRVDGSAQAAAPAIELLRRAIALDTPIEVLSDHEWHLTHRVAEEFRHGRVLLVGDSAHTLSPSGGFGLNTGLAAAANLGWKVAAALAGWAGPGLLDSYRAERRPVAVEAVEEANRNLARTMGRELPAALHEDGPRGELARAELARRLEESAVRREFDAPMIHMGYRYESAIVLPDRVPADPDEPLDRPNSRPGSRAPHAWLAPGHSVLDLFGRGFQLLDFTAQGREPAQLDGVVRAFADRRVPLTVTGCADKEMADLYRRRFVLVRPDGHVAWRDDEAPRDPGVLADAVRGAR
ncbi:FAD-dependent monooxygenase [Kitasatospora sp. NBC_01250]|uniref:FAD-dependent monooxygenase n=1 Tax=unclassified Kitasatospora TaxID=2633591 RepID=UPI002E11EDD2|nr:MULTISPECIES: FAD-dependent monooxygenase [unclassified Kitasatospora]WSJ70224.1 FAD-dependent monooxygenase [Kitasatospora sp. NBC_01302]